MRQVAYIILVRKVGRVLVIPFDRRFEEMAKIKEGDVFVPVTIKYKKHERITGKKDEVFGENHLALVLQRNSRDKILDISELVEERK